MGPIVVTDRADRPAAALLAEANRLAATSTLAWDVERRRALLADLDQAVALLTAARASVLLAERESGEWRGHGDRSFEAWRARTSRAGKPAAATEMRRAEAWVGMRAVREAVVGREAAAEHVDVLARLAAGASTLVREAIASDAGQAELAAMARMSDATTFARSVARWAAALDPEAQERDHQAQRAARFLHLSDSGAGTHVRGLLDRMAGHRLRLALEAVSPRPAVDDDRSPEQRRADALESLVDRALDRTTTSGGAARPHVSVVMTPETWRALRESARARSHPVVDEQPAADADADAAARVLPSPPSGAGRSGPPHDLSRSSRTGGHLQVGALRGAAPPATLEDGMPMPASELARALCDCELTRIVAGADSLPIDLGRTQRTYTGAQRRAVIVRDGGCGWPSCGAPARWCEVHHIRWWDRDGGATSVDNGVLLCSFHHHEVHRQQLGIRRELVRSLPAAAAGGRVSTRYVFTTPSGRVVAPQVARAAAGAGAGDRGNDGGGHAPPSGGGAAGGRGLVTAGRGSRPHVGGPETSPGHASSPGADGIVLALEQSDASPGP